MDETQKEWEAKYAPDKRIAELEAIIAELREALDRLISVAEECDGWEFFPSVELDAARSTLLEQEKADYQRALKDREST